MGIYSPRRATYELSVGSQAVPHPIYDYYSMSPRSTTVLQSGATASVPGLRIEVGTTAHPTHVVVGCGGGRDVGRRRARAGRQGKNQDQGQQEGSPAARVLH